MAELESEDIEMLKGKKFLRYFSSYYYYLFSFFFVSKLEAAAQIFTQK